MYKSIAAVFVSLLFSLTLNAQSIKTPETGKPATARGPVFRANKEQVIEVQRMLRTNETGKLDKNTREAVKSYQSLNGLRPTGTLNRATLEKMGVKLTDAQKAIPISANSYPKAEGSARKRGPVFRATKEQVGEAQKILKSKGLYKGAESGKLDDATREAIRSYQETAGLKATGTLNAATLDKMGIPLTAGQAGGSQGGSR